MPSITVITPTIGRDSLGVMFSQLHPQLAPGDEHLVIGDGPQPNAEKIIDQVKSPYVRYWEFPRIMNYGNPQRNQAISHAVGDYLMFIDDDDQVPPGSIEKVRKAADQYPGKILMFRMQHPPGPLWVRKELACGNVSGQMFICPNVKGKVGRWSTHYSADFDFMTSTVALYPENHHAIVWLEDIISIQGYAGPKGAGGKNMAPEITDFLFLDPM